MSNVSLYMLDLFITTLTEQLPTCVWYFGGDGSSTVVIPAVSESFGNIEILDEGEELTIYFGHFTHSHFSNPLVAVACLHDVFSDKLEFYGSHKAGGGFSLRGSNPKGSATERDTQVWSGHNG
jgi:hypothetical protein